MHLTPILSFNFHISYQKPFWLYHFQQTFLVYFVLRCEKTVNNYHHRHTCIRRQKLLLKYKSFTQHLTNTLIHTHTHTHLTHKHIKWSRDLGICWRVTLEWDWVYKCKRKNKYIFPYFSLYFIFISCMCVCVCK